MPLDSDLDAPLYGAGPIAEALNLRKDDGTPDVRKAYHALERGYVDADKFGRIWTSTKRRLLGHHLAAETAG
jgi:hypothetical protein